MISSVSSTSIEVEREHVFSANSSAYPEDGDLDGWYYKLLGIPFENWLLSGQIMFGNYTGTGGLDVSLTFDFVPRIVIVMNNAYTDIGNGGRGFIWVG